MRAEVQAEIEAARAAGEAWTHDRVFIDSDERIGATTCSVEGCRNGSAVVTYSTQLLGRLVYCLQHARRYRAAVEHARRAVGPLPGMEP